MKKDKFYIRYTSDDIVNLEKDTSISKIFVEVGLDGRVLREIGVDKYGEIVHKCPSRQYKHGAYGLFDLVRIDLSNRTNDLTKEEFENLWRKEIS